MQENKNKYYDIAERIYDLDGEVYECVGSSLGRTFTGDKRTCVNNLVMLMRTKPQGHLLRSELALISNMARTIRKDEDRSRLMNLPHLFLYVKQPPGFPASRFHKIPSSGRKLSRSSSIPACRYRSPHPERSAPGVFLQYILP